MEEGRGRSRLGGVGCVTSEVTGERTGRCGPGTWNEERSRLRIEIGVLSASDGLYGRSQDELTRKMSLERRERSSTSLGPLSDGAMRSG